MHQCQTQHAFMVWSAKWALPLNMHDEVKNEIEHAIQKAKTGAAPTSC
jgi:hypothetical protein